MTNEEMKKILDSVGKAVVPGWDDTLPVATNARFIMDKDGEIVAQGVAEFRTLDGKVTLIAWSYKNKQIDVRPKGSYYFPAQKA